MHAFYITLRLKCVHAVRWFSDGNFLQNDTIAVHVSFLGSPVVHFAITDMFRSTPQHIYKEVKKRKVFKQIKNLTRKPQNYLVNLLKRSFQQKRQIDFCHEIKSNVTVRNLTTFTWRITPHDQNHAFHNEVAPHYCTFGLNLINCKYFCREWAAAPINVFPYYYPT